MTKVEWIITSFIRHSGHYGRINNIFIDGVVNPVL